MCVSVCVCPGGRTRLPASLSATYNYYTKCSFTTFDDDMLYRRLDMILL